MNKKTFTLFNIAMLFAMAVTADAQVNMNLKARPDAVITSYAGSTRFKDLRGMWLDRKTNDFFVIEEQPLTVYKFDRYGSPVSYHALDDIGSDRNGATFAGVGPDGSVYLRHSGGMTKLSPDFSEWEKVEFFFAPVPDPDEEQELIPVSFKYVFPGRAGELYGFDRDKKIVYQCGADGRCKVFIRALMKYGADVLTGNMKNAIMDAWGRFFLVDEQSRQIWMFSAEGRFLGAAARSLDPVADKLYQPELIAFDRFKQRFIYDAGVMRIKMFNDVGLPSGELDVNQMTGPMFINPLAMEIDDLNRMYVLDKGDMTIKIFEISY